MSHRTMLPRASDIQESLSNQTGPCERQAVDARQRGVTARALLLAGVFAVLGSLQMVVGVFLLGGRDPSVFSLFQNAVFLLLVLSLLNRYLKARFARWAFSQGELLTIYVLVSISTALMGIDMLQVLPGVISYPFWGASGGA
ncbi:MAG: hypothetical protein GTO63_28160, partial [Anaerolineae bacterium]|nr:hypothetical protein [Anaerolineae bacterium]NIN98615.1 hypothetical protein [Anaerolineae bacterium]NIQ81501.1 hypothetical protein [Anaerolineae bacterium]